MNWKVIYRFLHHCPSQHKKNYKRDNKNILIWKLIFHLPEVWPISLHTTHTVKVTCTWQWLALGMRSMFSFSKLFCGNFIHLEKIIRGYENASRSITGAGIKGIHISYADNTCLGHVRPCLNSVWGYEGSEVKAYSEYRVSSEPQLLTQPDPVSNFTARLWRDADAQR